MTAGTVVSSGSGTLRDADAGCSEEHMLAARTGQLIDTGSSAVGTGILIGNTSLRSVAAEQRRSTSSTVRFMEPTGTVWQDSTAFGASNSVAHAEGLATHSGTGTDNAGAVAIETDSLSTARPCRVADSTRSGVVAK